MRHQVFGRKLNRDIKERKALFKNLILALINKGKIRTTFPKAKAILRLGEKLVTKAKDGSGVALRQVSSFLNRKDAIDRLINNIVPRFKSKVGGYIRMIKVGRRQGDNAEEVILEWSVKEEEKNKKLETQKVEKPATQRAQEKKV